MGEGIVTACRGCRSKRIKDALKINGKLFIICQTCTLLQIKDNIPYNITFDLSSGAFTVDYYPYYLLNKFPKEEKNLYFSLKSVEAILEQAGYKVVHAQTTDEGQLEVQFEKMDNLDRIRVFEMQRKLSSQFTYFLYSVKKR